MKNIFQKVWMKGVVPATLAAMCITACGTSGNAGNNVPPAGQNTEAAGNTETGSGTADVKAAEAAGSTAADPKAAGVSENAVVYTPGPQRHVIIDTDTGADDAAAIILAAMADNIDIKGITVLLGNVELEQAAMNALASLEIAGKEIPVYKGSASTYDGERKEAFSVFGMDGMGDADLIHPTARAEEADGIDFIIDTVRENPGEIEILALGPATDIALAYEKAPEVMKNVKMIWLMGTAGLGMGNASPVAEFNVYADAPAYEVLLSSGLPATILGLDMCDGDAMWGAEEFERLDDSGEVGQFITASFGKLREFYMGNGYGDYIMNCDPGLVMCLVYPDYIQDTVQCDATCITDDSAAYGQVIFYKDGFTYDAVDKDMDYHVTLITDVDDAGYFDRYYQTVTQ